MSTNIDAKYDDLIAKACLKFFESIRRAVLFSLLFTCQRFIIKEKLAKRGRTWPVARLLEVEFAAAKLPDAIVTQCEYFLAHFIHLIL